MNNIPRLEYTIRPAMNNNFFGEYKVNVVGTWPKDGIHWSTYTRVSLIDPSDSAVQHNLAAAVQDVHDKYMDWLDLNGFLGDNNEHPQHNQTAVDRN